MGKKRELNEDIDKLCTKVREVADHWQLNEKDIALAIDHLLRAKADKIVGDYMEGGS